MESKLFDVIIIGSGPAGCSAAVYCSRANLNTAMIKGSPSGGQLTTTTMVENFLGFVEIDGTELVSKFHEHAKVSGCFMIEDNVKQIKLQSQPFEIITETGQIYLSKTVILAVGASAKRLGVMGESTFWQKGISSCAVCDGALKCFRNKPLAVVGGGDTACEEALHLSRFGSKVYMIHRSDQFRASGVMMDRVKKTNNITIITHTIVTCVKGDQESEMVNGLLLKNTKTGEEYEMAVSGLFYAIGHVPNTDFLENQIVLDQDKYVLVKQGTTQTSVRGVFACGDCQDKKYRQAITAAGSGCMAALDTSHFLSETDRT